MADLNKLIGPGHPAYPPQDVMDAAEKVGRWFAENNIKGWELGPCADRWNRRATPSSADNVAGGEAVDYTMYPVEPKALEKSIAELDAWLETDGCEPLTVSEGESVLLVLRELKRLRADRPSATSAAAPVSVAQGELTRFSPCVTDGVAGMMRNPKGSYVLLSDAQAAIAAARRSVSAAAMDGWKWVPLGPTEEMLAAGARWLQIISLPEREAGSVYRAMLAAAPSPDAPAGGKDGA